MPLVATICTKCGEPTDWDESLGDIPLCVGCWDIETDHWNPYAEKMRAYRQEHKEELAEKKRAYRQEHKEELAEKMRAYYQEHKDSNDPFLYPNSQHIEELVEAS